MGTGSNYAAAARHCRLPPSLSLCCCRRPIVPLAIVLTSLVGVVVAQPIVFSSPSGLSLHATVVFASPPESSLSQPPRCSEAVIFTSLLSSHGCCLRTVVGVVIAAPSLRGCHLRVAFGVVVVRCCLHHSCHRCQVVVTDDVTCELFSRTWLRRCCCYGHRGLHFPPPRHG
jgi:hypothetical protein